MNVTLREISAATLGRIITLSVTPEQQQFVAYNSVSLAEALFSPEAWYRAIYHDDEPAGFVMLYDETLRPVAPENPQVAIWRFMIDRNFQGRGIGAAALQLVVAHVRAQARCRTLLVSYVPGPGCPEPFYLRGGFRHTGRVDDGEVVLELPL